MAADYRTRLFVDDSLAADAVITLRDSRAHYVRSVLRLGVADRVALFNGRDGEWLAAIDAVTKRTVALRVGARARPQAAAPDIWLVFAPLKRTRLDYAAQKATELGVSCLWPVFTRFTAVERINTDRLTANAIEAAAQSGRLDVPEIRQPVSFAALLEAWPAERRLFCCDETGGGQPILDAVAEYGRGPAAVLTGPEGGFADAELDRLDKLANVCRVSLGGRVLRADTAAMAALACWQAAVGDWADRRKGGGR